MSTYTVVPILKVNGFKYTAPIFYIEASSNKDAVELGRNKSGLGRFKIEDSDEYLWNFHVIETSKVFKSYKGKSVLNTKKDSNSNRSKRRANRNFNGSRPNRRALKRLANSGLPYDGQKKKYNLKITIHANNK